METRLVTSELFSLQLSELCVFPAWQQLSSPCVVISRGGDALYRTLVGSTLAYPPAAHQD